MVTKIQRWGNSLGLRIPKSFAEETNIRAGSVVDIAIDDGHLVIRPIRSKKYALRDLLKNVRPQRMHGEISTGVAVGREAW